MNIQAAKLSLIEKILQTKEESIIAGLQEFFSTETTDHWDELSEEDKASIERGINDIENGRKISLEDFLNKYKAQ
ncbi:MAG: hypothetical protein ABI723_21075 [Bacteroidia bacterium]